MALSILVILVLPILPIPAAEAQVLPAACDVPSGTSIQGAIDRAAPGDTIIVCPGTFQESLRIAKDGLTLRGLAGAIIDGRLATGPKSGIVIATGVRDVTVEGFLIRNWNDPLSGIADTSSGIRVKGSTTGIAILDNTFTDNGWAGITFDDGPHRGVHVARNTASAHGVADLFLQGLDGAVIHANSLTPKRYGMIVSGASSTRLDGNTITAVANPGAVAGIVLAPDMLTGASNAFVFVTGNTVQGVFDHGIWAVDSTDLAVTGNSVERRARHAITLAGNLARTTLSGNEASLIFEVASDEAPVNALIRGATSSVCTTVGDCRVAQMITRIDDAVRNVLYPLASPSNTEDAARLARCEGQPDSCLTAEFFDPRDTTGATWWSTGVNHPTLGDVTIRFPDVGIRKAADDLAWHTMRAALDQDWTTLVLCRTTRHLADAATTACDAMPRGFDYALAITWETSDTDQALSAWRQKLPTDAMHATFDRIHGPDATLFKKTTRPHHADSPRATAAGDATPAPPADPAAAARVHHAGTAVLRCDIVASATPDDARDALAPARATTCPEVRLLTEDIPVTGTRLLTCSARQPDHEAAVHDTTLTEAVTLWPWSDTCAEPAAGTTPTLPWTSLFTAADLDALADAQLALTTATSQGAIDAARILVQEELAGAIARHVALRVPEHGMPMDVDDTMFTTLPGVLGATLAAPRDGMTATWTGSEAILLGGADDRTILSYDPAQDKVTTRAATIPSSREGASGVWTGTRVVILGGTPSASDGFVSDTAQSSILTYDPLLDTIAGPIAFLPKPLRHAGAFHDPRPTLACPAGCTYILGGETRDPTGAFAPTSAILVHDPVTRTVEKVAELPFPLSRAAVAFDGNRATIAGGTTWTGDSLAILRFDPASRTVTTLTTTLPAPRVGAAAVRDGDGTLVLGGEDSPRSMLTIGADGTVISHPLPLPEDAVRAPAVRTGSATLVFGTAESAAAPATHITRVPPTSAGGAPARPQDHARDFHVIPLTGAPSAQANVAPSSARVPDRIQGWLTVDMPELLAFTETEFTYTVRYLGVNGDLLAHTGTLLLTDAAPTLAVAPHLITYDGTGFVHVFATDSGNRDPIGGYQVDAAGATALPHTFPVLSTVTAPGAPTNARLIHGDFAVPADATSLVACVDEWVSGTTAGDRANFAESRLAVPRTAVDCLTLHVPALADLKARIPLATSLIVTGSDDFTVSLEVADQPLAHLAARGDDGAALTLDNLDAIAATFPTLPGAEPVTVRITIGIPVWITAVEQAQALATLIGSALGLVDVIAVELEDLPLSPDLQFALTSARQQGIVTLVPAGTLPATAWALPTRDKLMTIHGLAGTPLAITIGAGSAAGGVSPWSRLGPTPMLLPKPDLVAPAIPGDTGSAVAHVLPFVEAVVLRGERDIDLVRGILAALAEPVSGDGGAAATFWEQGFGAVDAAATFPMPSATQLLEGMGLRILPPGAGKAEARAEAVRTLATRFGVDASAIDTADAAALVGVAESTRRLARLGVTASFDDLAVAIPVLPDALVTDFGTTNPDQPAASRLGLLGYNGVLGATTTPLGALLQSAGYALADADAMAAALGNVMGARAADSKVRINVTHHYTFDLLTKDLLYTGLDTLLGHSLADAPRDPSGTAATAASREALAPWLLDGYQFMPETTLTVNRPPIILDTCTHALLPDARQFLSLVAIVLDERAAIMQTLDSGPAPGLLDTRGDLAFMERRIASAPCLDDLIALARELTNLTGAMQAATHDPVGAWTLPEAVAGTWDATPLGRAIRDTGTALGLDTRTLVAGDVDALRAVDAALDDLITILDGTIRRLETPRLMIETQDVILRTDPARTQAPGARVGPYTGFAYITTEGITVVDPQTGEARRTRNVTIPIPSFLMLTPTLYVAESFRGGAPYGDTDLGITRGGGGVITNITYSLSRDEGGIRVPLHAAGTLAVEPDAATGSAHISQVRALIDLIADDSIGVGPAYKALTLALLDEFVDAVANWTSSRACSDNCIGVPRSAYAPSTFNAALNEQHSYDQAFASRTNASGIAAFRNVYPGGYDLSAAYPYGYGIVLDQDSPYAFGGTGVFQGPFQTEESLLARLAHLQTREIITHPTARTDAPIPPRLDEFPVIEKQGIPIGPVHPFTLDVVGPDLVGVACADARRFTTSFGTPLTYAGCGAPVVEETVKASIDTLRAWGHCLARDTWNRSFLDIPVLAEGCRAIRTAWTEARAVCILTGDCADLDNLTPLVGAARNLTRVVESVATYETAYLVPWARSPARVLVANPDDYGFSETALRARAKQANPGASNASVDAAVRDIRTNLWTLANTSITVHVPGDSFESQTLAQGVLHHVTDKVSGLDWTHHTLDVPAPRTSVNDVTVAIDRARSVLVDLADRALIREFQKAVARAAGTNPQATLDVFNAAILRPNEDVRDRILAGWTANGTSSRGGFGAAPTASNRETMTGNACRSALADREALPASYFTCDGLSWWDNRTDLTRGGVDSVAFANAILDTKGISGVAKFPPERVHDVLAKTAQVARAPDDLDVARTQDGFGVQAALGGIARAGILHYAVPLPANEILQYRLSGEFLLKNTGALVITSGNPHVTAAVVGAVDSLDLSAAREAAGSDGIDRSLAVPLHVLDTVGSVVAAVTDKEPLLRADLMGVPAGIEWRAKMSEYTWNALEGQVASTLCRDAIACSEGMTGAWVNEYREYARTHDWVTRASGDKPETLDVLIVYFPLATTPKEGDLQELAAAPQEFVVRDFAVQVKTFIGYRVDPGATGFLLDVRNANHPRVEDWQMLYAVPDEPVNPAAGAPGIRVSVTLGSGTKSATWMPTDADLISGAQMRGIGTCARDSSRGFTTASLEAITRIVPYDGYFITDANTCFRNDIVALEPRNVDFGFSSSYPATGKRVIDALQYVVNLIPIELFSIGGTASPGGGRANHQAILNLPSYATASATSLTGRILDQEALAVMLPTALAAAGIAPTPTHLPPVSYSELPAFTDCNVCPSVTGFTLDTGPALHNFVILDGARMRALFDEAGLGYDPLVPMTVMDAGAGAGIAAPDTGRRLHADAWPLETDPARATAIAAHAHNTSVRWEGHGNGTTVRVSMEATFLAGHGNAGTGVAIRVNETSTTNTTSGTQRSFVVETLTLGSSLTKGSDCREIPLYEYVKNHFRCIGYDPTKRLAQHIAAKDPCATEAARFVSVAAVATRDHAKARGMETGGSTPAYEAAIAHLTGNTGTPDGIVTSTAAVHVPLADHDAYLASRFTDADALLTCLATAAGVLPVADAGALDVALDQVRLGLDAVRDVDLAAGRQHLRNAVLALDPALAPVGGAPREDVLVALDSSLDTGFVKASPDRRITYAVEPWAAVIVEGALTVTDHAPDGTTHTRTVLAAPDGREPAITSAAATHAGKTDACAVPAGTGILLAGGDDTGTIRRYDPAGGATQRIAATLPVPVKDAACAWTGSHLVVLGGVTTGGAATDAIQIVDPAAGTAWESEARLPSPTRGAPAVWTGAEVLLVGGMTAAGLTSRILAYDPATADLQQYAHLTSLRADHGALWLEPGSGSGCPVGCLVVAGGRYSTASSGTTNTAHTYDPSRGKWTSVGTLPWSGPTDLAEAAGDVYAFRPHGDGAAIARIDTTHAGDAVAMDAAPEWARAGTAMAGAGDHVLAFEAATGRVFRYDGARDAPRGSVLAIGRPDSTLLAFEDGHAYTVRLSVMDESGTTHEATRHVTADGAAPVFPAGSGPADTVLAGASATLTWAVEDAGSGIHGATLERWHAGANRWIPVSHILPAGTTGAAAATVATVVDDRTLHGNDGTVRLVATDGAGNTATSVHAVILDGDAPLVDVAVAGLVDGLLKADWFNATISIFDGGAGLDSVDVWLHESGSGTTTPLAQDAGIGGARVFTVASAVEQPVPDALYTVHVDVVDRSGNRRILETPVQMAVPPTLTVHAPAYVAQDIVGPVTFAADARMPYGGGGSGDRVDEVSIRVTRIDDGNLVREHTAYEPAGLVTAQWTPTAADAGQAFLVTTTATKGLATVAHEARVTVRVPDVHGVAALETPTTYATLAAGEDSDTFRYTHPAVGCAGWFRMIVTVVEDGSGAGTGDGSDGSARDVDFSLGGAGVAYTQHVTGDATTFLWADAQPGASYALRVDRAPGSDGDVMYEVTRERHCNDGEAPPERAEVRVVEGE